VQLLEQDLVETYSAGGGKGGQKVNRTNNKVNLKHLPTGIIVHCHRTRSLHDNRRIARSLLVAKLDQLLNGAASKPAIAAAKQQRRKARSRRRSALKHAAHANESRVQAASADDEPCRVAGPSKGTQGG
jgi:protein subunit release factor B